MVWSKKIVDRCNALHVEVYLLSRFDWWIETFNIFVFLKISMK